jgi:phosphoenolpyruvate-protein kinase (PTS system EI component)
MAANRPNKNFSIGVNMLSPSTLVLLQKQTADFTDEWLKICGFS